MVEAWQQLVVRVIVALAALWWVRHLFLRVRGGRGAGCGKSCACARPTLEKKGSGK